MPDRCPVCGKFVDSSDLDAIMELDYYGNYFGYCSYECKDADYPRRIGEEPDVIY